MKKLTYNDVVAAGKTAYLNGTLQAANEPPDGLEWHGCYYRFDHHEEDLDENDINNWKGAQALTCVVGASFSPEHEKAVRQAGQFGSLVSHEEVWEEIFDERDLKKVMAMQQLHDAWAQRISNWKEARAALLKELGVDDHCGSGGC